jgi:S-DNA-T family DNA segregation ATPase FtsK/SpoIIIE
MTDDRRRQLVGVLLLFLGLLVGVSLATHVYFAMSDDLGPEIWTTQLGLQNRQVSGWMFDLLGICAWVVPVLLVMWGWNRIADDEPGPLALRSVFILAVSMIVVALIYTVGGGRTANVTGLAGALMADFGIRHIGRLGTFLAGAGAVVVITLLTTDFDIDMLTAPFIALGGWLAGLGESLRDWVVSLTEREPRERSRAPGRSKSRPKQGARPRKRPAREKAAPEPARSRRATARAKAEQEAEPTRAPRRRAPSVPKIMETRRPKARKAPPKRVPQRGDFTLPPLSLLDDPPPDSHDQVSREELLARSRLLEEKLADFDVEAAVVQVHPGPVITRFEIEPARGVKVSRIANLQDDLALAMKATAIRIIAPIPGRGAVGIEIPNEHPQVVYLKDTLAADAFQNLKSEIPLALGKDTTGRVACADLAKMPHLLVAGATGSGKSICLNALITGLIFRSTPAEVRFLMIDPKRLELPRYSGIPHLISPVVTDAKQAGLALQWLVSEMDRRYDILSTLTVRDIYGFNRRIDNGTDLDALPEGDRHRLPHIVVIVDEFADLMVRAPRDVEAPVQRLAQMARAVGIHLVFATQRPSVDVITGVIKANFASRIAFRVISMTDSRTVLDRNGAETLLGNGDMLFLPTGKPDPVRLHGAFIANEETARLVAFMRKQGPPNYMFDLEEKGGTASKLAASQQDELYEKALEVVVGTQMGSTSLLQRRLSVGYARAGRLMDLLETNGIVGPFKGSKARDVLVGPEYLQEIAAGVATAVADPIEDDGAPDDSYPEGSWEEPEAVETGDGEEEEEYEEEEEEEDEEEDEEGDEEYEEEEDDEDEEYEEEEEEEYEEEEEEDDEEED